MGTVLTVVLTAAGTFFMLVAAIGVLRMPDLLMRMHAATKAGTVGASLLLLAVAVHFGETGVAIRALATIVFLVLTGPVAAHVIGRAAYLSGSLRLWERTLVDEWREASEKGPAPGA
jgi:multicomponent Na+:H+ antiporter subunit G